MTDAELEALVPQKRSFRIPEVANILDVRYRLAYELVASGELPHFKIANHKRVARQDLIEYLKRNYYRNDI